MQCEAAWSAVVSPCLLLVCLLSTLCLWGAERSLGCAQPWACVMGMHGKQSRLLCLHPAHHCHSGNTRHGRGSFAGHS